jgi:hypothetical protein
MVARFSGKAQKGVSLAKHHAHALSVRQNSAKLYRV